MHTTVAAQAHDDPPPLVNPLLVHEPPSPADGTPRRVPLDPAAREQVKRDSDRRATYRTLELPTFREAEEMRAARAFIKERDAVRRARRDAASRSRRDDGARFSAGVRRPRAVVPPGGA